MKKITILLLFLFLSVSLFSESSWTDSAGETATVTIINPKSNFALVEMNVVYNQEILASLHRGDYVEVDVPVGDNLFFLVNYSYRNDVILIEAEAGQHYYIKLSQVYSFMNFKMMDSLEGQMLVNEYSSVE